MLILSFSPPKSYDDFFSDTFVPKIILIRIRVYLHEDTKKSTFHFFCNVFVVISNILHITVWKRLKIKITDNQ